jgi:ligand-binding SRPBCC domain-containing protein
MSYVNVSTVIPATPDKVYAYIADMNNLAALMPDDLQLKLTSPIVEMARGAEFEYELKRFGFSQVWGTKIEELTPEKTIVERQVLGFFHSWVNTYNFEAHGEASTLMTNIVEFTMPLGLIGRLLDDLYVRRDLCRILETAQRKLQEHFAENTSGDITGD